ncbi:MAG: preprotein translocase subunit SecG [Chloroflexi bacterium RBG_16_48_7]|nr:MAG: preprotein translocase subunit SecG [Chloroflexi bacterium RBG_16_48_7]
MSAFLLITQIILGIALVAVLLLQVKGGGLGGIFGQAEGIYRTRRGVEKSLFLVTIVLVVIFITISLVIVKINTSV